jgi:hypothetical protein
MAFLRQQVEQGVAAFEKENADPKARFEARHLTIYAHWTLALGQDPSKAEQALRRVMTMQEMNANSPRYGEFPSLDVPGMSGGAGSRSRSRGDEEADEDAAHGAATELAVLPMAQVVIRYGAKIPEPLRNELIERLRAAGSVVRDRRLPPDQGNLFLLNAINLLLIGDITQDDKLIAEARSRLDQFIGVARSRGIAEYVSPTYTAVQLNWLLVGHNYTLQPDARRQIEPILKFLWAQIAANALVKRGMLAGPHGRDYDFPYGLGAIDSYLLLEDLRDIAPVNALFSEGLRGWVNYSEKCLRPDEEILKLATTYPRVVRMRWGAGAGQDRYLYVTDSYAIGTSSATLGVVDKKITVEFNTFPPLPTMWVVADPFDAPTGRVKNARTGQVMRPAHLREQIVTVQETDTLLALMNLRPDVKGSAMPSVATNVTIPARANALVLDGKPVATDKPFELPVTNQSVVIVRSGAGVAAAQIFVADGLAGQQPAMFLKYDGNSMGLARLVAYHYRAPAGARPTPLPDAPVRAGIILMTAKCTKPEEASAFLARVAAAKVEHAVEGRAWTAKLIDGQTTLEAGLDLQTGEILKRKINGKDHEPAAFKVNDRDLSAEFLGF